MKADRVEIRKTRSCPPEPALFCGMDVRAVRHETVLTLTTYADYIGEDEQAAPKVGRGVVEANTVVPLQRISDSTGFGCRT
jgi:hypothetical protein